MKDIIKIPKKEDHIAQWGALKRFYKDKRGSDAGRFGKAIPRTTNEDVAQIAAYWEREFRVAVFTRPFAADKSQSSRRKWREAKHRIDDDLADSKPRARYRDNQWFWDTATAQLSIYLESLKVVPNHTTLLYEALGETVEERYRDIKNVGAEVQSWFKKAMIGAGIIGATALVLPPVIRAFRDDRDKRR